MENQNNIRIIFTDKAYSALDDIIKKFNLSESIEEDLKRSNEGKMARVVIINHFAKDFARGILSEKNLVDSLQKDLEISPQIAEQISKEIITNIVPFLEKISEESLNNQKNASKELFENPLEEKKREINEKTIEIFPKIKPLEAVTEKTEKPESKIAPPPKKLERIKKPEPQTRPRTGPDNYREPIE